MTHSRLSVRKHEKREEGSKTAMAGPLSPTTTQIDTRLRHSKPSLSFRSGIFGA